MSRLARGVFALLVVATFSAFFVAQRLKSAPPVVGAARVMKFFSPNGDGTRDVETISFRVQEPDEVSVEKAVYYLILKLIFYPHDDAVQAGANVAMHREALRVEADTFRAIVGAPPADQAFELNALAELAKTLQTLIELRNRYSGQGLPFIEALRPIWSAIDEVSPLYEACDFVSKLKEANVKLIPR